ncbi:Plant invertase/pectin methylesterase inhibitor superfamily [Euphorbia peplus]|nr:Plant invertase/pectin methylesterase inhibitor superfamily [Euphorbia peplus]
MQQFYSQCDISGTIDFIFGYAAAVFQDCNIYLRRPLDGQSNVMTAQGRTAPYQNTGITIRRSRIKASKRLQLVGDKVKRFLGRPWKPYSRTVVMGSYINGVIDPSRWLEWERQSPPSTLKDVYIDKASKLNIF